MATSNPKGSGYGNELFPPAGSRSRRVLVVVVGLAIVAVAITLFVMRS